MVVRMKLKTFPKHTENTSEAAENVCACPCVRCRLSQFACACDVCGCGCVYVLICSYGPDTKRKWKRLFYIYCLISYENVKCFYGNNININSINKAAIVLCEFVNIRAGVRACVCLCECLILKVKWFYAILIICVNEYEYLLDNCIAYAIELSRSWLPELLKIDFCWVLRRLATICCSHIHIHKQNVCYLHLKFTNWTKYNIHLIKTILTQRSNEFRFRLNRI